RSAAGHDGTVRIGTPEPGAPLHPLTGHTDRVWALAADPAGNWLASASDDHTVRIWNPETGATLHTLTSHPPTDGCRTRRTAATDTIRYVVNPVSSVWALAAGPAGRWLASTNDDHTVAIWDPETGARRHARTAQPHSVRDLA